MICHIDRREFLALLAAVGGSSVARATGGKKVVVLGAGLAGLSAAWNLRQAGFGVSVLEAQKIPGGRVKTIRDPFTHGLYAETGAVRA